MSHLDAPPGCSPSRQRNALTNHGFRLPGKRALGAARVALAILVGVAGGVVVPGTSVSAAAPKALIYGNTVSGSPSREETDLVAQGWTVTVVTAATWGGMTAAQFGTYQLLVFGDPTCSADPTILNTAVANESTWAPKVNGSVLVFGTDPVYHYGSGIAGAGKLINQGLAYAGGQAGKTGLYLDLSCYYNNGLANQHVAILDGFEAGFLASSPGCADNIHIVATAPQLVGLTDADLSGWSCSLHEYLNAWPSDFTPIAIDTSAAALYTAPDGTKGTPYILGRGAIAAGSIALAGPAGSAPINTNQTLTVTVESGGSPVSGAVVTLKAISGPNTGSTNVVTTGVGGTATFSYASATVGTDQWTASYTPSGGTLQTSAPAAVVWTQASTSFTASATPASISFGNTSLLAETGLPGAATGTVTFKSGASTLCTATLSTTSCTTAMLAAGTYPITATYSGDTNYTGSTATTSLTVTTAATAFTASATPSSVTFGTSSTLAEAGLPGGATGTVTFTSGAATLCIATLSTASCTTSTSLAAGTYPITASYSGDGNYSGSTATTSLTVTMAASSFTASATPSSVPYGASSTLAVSGLPGAATGMVTFKSGAATLCTASLPTASCSSSTTLAAGSYPITATYPGDGNYTGSTATTNLTVTKVATSFTASATPASVAFGVSSSLGETGLPAGAGGTITFMSGATLLCIATLPTTSCATSTTLPAGSYPVTATYSGDGNHFGSTATTSLTVTKASTSFTASATPGSVVYGTTSTLAESGLQGNATGTVTFTSGATLLCTANLPTTNCATSTTLAAGSYPATATYSGDGNHGGSTASTSLTVTKAATSFAASATLPTVTYGVSSSLGETGLPAGAGGTITFKSGATVLCIASLPTASCLTSTSLPAGTYPVTGTYSGDGNYLGSTATTSLTVTMASTAFTASATPSSVAYGTSSSLAESGLPGDATGTVTFTSGATILCTASLPTTTCATSTTLVVGSYLVTATYPGDGNYTGSTAMTSLTVTQAATSFTASATPSSVAFGVSSSLGEAGLPAGAGGTITFMSGVTLLCATTLPTTSCATSTTLPAASYPVTATYSGDSNYLGSTATTSLTVTMASTAFTASATPGSVVYGTSSTLAESGLQENATGTVTFASAGSTLCVAILPATSCLTSTGLGAGTYPVTATYSGDGNYVGSTASTSLTVTKAATSLTAAATPSSVSYGVGSVLAVSGLPIGATGTVTFTSGLLTLCTVTLPATSCTSSTTLPAGSYPATATYSGDSNHSGSSGSTNLAVTPAASTTTVTSSQNPGAINQPVIYTATVGPNPGSGTVAFTDNGVIIPGCAAVPIDPVTGKATCTTSYTGPGSHSIVATFSGNANYQASSAPTSGVLALSQVIAAALPAAGVYVPGGGTSSWLALQGALVVLLILMLALRAKRRRSETI